MWSNQVPSASSIARQSSSVAEATGFVPYQLVYRLPTGPPVDPSPDQNCTPSAQTHAPSVVLSFPPSHAVVVTSRVLTHSFSEASSIRTNCIPSAVHASEASSQGSSKVQKT